MIKRTREYKVDKCKNCGGNIIGYVVEYTNGDTLPVVGCEKCHKDKLEVKLIKTIIMTDKIIKNDIEGYDITLNKLYKKDPDLRTQGEEETISFFKGAVWALQQLIRQQEEEGL